MFDDLEKGKLPDAKKSVGWIKIAFAYSFFYLREACQKGISEILYRETIKRMLMEGGDTDTNAAIVGGMIGALVGFNGIP